MVKFFRNRNKTDLTYVLRFEVETKNQFIEINILQNKKQWKQFCYHFDGPMPIFPYNLFFKNRCLLHCLMTVCTEFVPDLEHCSKVIIQSNNSYLKHLKDWFHSWKKNKFCIEHFSSQNEKSNRFEESNDINTGFFNFSTMCSFYFSFVKDTQKQENNDVLTFHCPFVTEQEKPMLERLLERPNTDLILRCSNIFDETCKLYRFV